MSHSTDSYEPPKVWQAPPTDDSKFANINRPTAGAQRQQDLPVGKHPYQLYSLATPNGQKVTIMFEELLALGHADAEYDAHLIKIMEGDQFTSGFVAANPNSKIPAMVDTTTATPTRVFESGAILFYLAEKFSTLIPDAPAARTECLNWLFWQVGSAPYLGGGFGHFYSYAPTKIRYCIDRFAMESKRQLDLLDQHLASRAYIAGEGYSIADIAIWPWYGELARGNLYRAGDFLDVASYTHVVSWANKIAERPAVKRGRRVNNIWGDEDQQLAERHDATDLA